GEDPRRPRAHQAAAARPRPGGRARVRVRGRRAGCRGLMVERILVATDRSETAERAVAWAGEMARRYEAELLVLHVVVPDQAGTAVESRAETAAAGDRTRTKVVVHANPATAIIETARDEDVDVVVVGN